VNYSLRRLFIINGENISIGKTANEKRITEPFNTGSLFKRYMGSGHKTRLDLKQYTAPELSAFVLRSLKEDAEEFLQEKVDEAVVSVPAYFNAIQRKATIQAAEMVGLRVERLVNEPTAAAMAYGVHEKPEHTQFLVLDLGRDTAWKPKKCPAYKAIRSYGLFQTDHSSSQPIPTTATIKHRTPIHQC